MSQLVLILSPAISFCVQVLHWGGAGRSSLWPCRLLQVGTCCSTAGRPVPQFVSLSQPSAHDKFAPLPSPFSSSELHHGCHMSRAHPWRL